MSDAAVSDGRLANELVATLTERGQTIAVAESLTGGLLVAEFIRVPGASLVINGGVVAYNTELKHTILGVDALLLAEHGPVHPEVAAQMASGARHRLAVGGVPATIGLSTTGVAGPGPQDGHPAGTAFVGIDVDGTVKTLSLSLDGDREAIRREVVSESLRQLHSLILGPLLPKE